jgi:ATP-dependent RNA helicase RhlE
MPAEIQQLANVLLTNPSKVEVTPPSSTVDAIQQALYYVEKENKKHLLIHLLQDASIQTALVFSRTKHGADKIARGLSAAGIRAEAIHGNKSQNARQSALSNFKSRRTRVLVATDIAARGIDIDELTHVFNHDLPNVPETYVHRIGRTGRAGASGIAISFCDAEEKTDLRDIQKLINKSIPVVTEHPYVMTHNSQVVRQPVQKGPSFQRRTPHNNNGSRQGQGQRNQRSSYSGRS